MFVHLFVCLGFLRTTAYYVSRKMILQKKLNKQCEHHYDSHVRTFILVRQKKLLPGTTNYQLKPREEQQDIKGSIVYIFKGKLKSYLSFRLLVLVIFHMTRSLLFDSLCTSPRAQERG